MHVFDASFDHNLLFLSSWKSNVPFQEECVEAARRVLQVEEYHGPLLRHDCMPFVEIFGTALIFEVMQASAYRLPYDLKSIMWRQLRRAKAEIETEYAQRSKLTLYHQTWEKNPRCTFVLN